MSGIITSDETWTSTDSPYIITGTTSVNTGLTLTIEPGVEVRFESGMSMQVDGELVAIGTADSMVTFTSDSDTVAGSWGFIKFTDSSVDATFDGGGNYTGGSILQYCKVFYGGGSGANGAIQLDSATPFIDHCEIKNNGQRGIYANNLSGVLKITNSTIIDNSNSGIYTSGDTVIISNNTIDNNSANRGAGIYVSNGTVTISSNTINSNRTSGYQPNGGGIYVSNGTVTIYDNIISNNMASGGYNHIYGGGVYVSGGTVSVSNNQIIDNYSDHYAGGIYISGSESSILDGNLIQGNVSEGSGNSSGGGITVNGSVTVSNNTIIGNSGIQGGGIYTGNNYSGTISSNNFTNNTASNGGAIFGTGSVINNTITANFSSSSIIYYSGENISYNTITDNVGGNTVYIASTALFNNNNIFGNTSNYDIYNGTSNNVDATNNWWGTIDETAIQEQIYDWFDDASKGIVNYTPYLLSNDPNAPLMPPQNLTITPGNQQVTLSWNANIESDLHKYKIYRSMSSPAQTFLDSVIASSPPDTFYLDTTVINNQTYYYRITAVDSAGNESGFSNEVSAKTVIIPLNVGWNLISWDVDTPNDSVGVLLSDIMDNVVVVLGFEAGGLTYDPDWPQFNTLELADHLHAYWIKTTEPDTLIIGGAAVSYDTPITVEAGWNLVSYLPDNPDSIAHALGSILDRVIVVLGFNEGGLTYDPNWPQFSNLQILSPGFGYWIKMTDPGTLVYPDAQVAAGRSLAKVQDHISSGRSILYTNE
ncbi:MAG: right-handed parallel beta-helix repeat-containing protein, partial [Candidatus Marinimicrobia bacterium]|nr:right-handed parallel beta-helix repeat-containing protein [Candidatus Neomarinimicrobiota bacterium]